MSGKFVLKKERGRFRYILSDEKGNAVFSGPFLIEKSKALLFLDVMTTVDSFADHLAPTKGPDGKWILRGELHSSREGEEGNKSDGTPLGFSQTFGSEEELEKARKNIVKLMKGAEVVDES